MDTSTTIAGMAPITPLPEGRQQAGANNKATTAKPVPPGSTDHGGGKLVTGKEGEAESVTKKVQSTDTITDQIIDQAVADGETNVQIAEKIGVAPCTVGRWRSKGQAPGKRPGTEEKENAVILMQSEGMQNKEIATVLGLKEKSIYDISLRARKEGKNPLTLPRRVKTAVKVYDTFMQGKPIGREEGVDPDTGVKVVINPGVYPKCSTIKACADAITDRAFPKQSDLQGPSISFTQINLGAPLPIEIDVTLSTTGGIEAYNSEPISIDVTDSSMLSSKV